jgi:hypothetical protein
MVSASDVSIDFYERVRWDLDQWRDILTPRIMLGPDQPALVDALISVDDARRNLHHAIIAHREAVTHSVFPHVLTLVERCATAYEELRKPWQAELTKGA